MINMSSVFDNQLCQLSSNPIITYNTDNLALIKLYGKEKLLPILITNYSIQDSAKSQIVQCFNDKKSIYFFGNNPRIISITGIIPTNREADMDEEYFSLIKEATNSDIATTIIIVMRGYVIEGYWTGYTKSVSANTSCFYNANLTIIGIENKVT